jgi:6-pyruvoyltetrahydropterin/6-carboxytetrahydropterin synthase
VYTATTEIHFAYGHRLLDYIGKCAHPHGHNARVEIEVEAEQLDVAGMATDFTVLKHGLQDWVDEHLDHQMLLRRDDPLVPVLQGMQEPIYVMEVNPTAETLARLLYDLAAQQGFSVAMVRFWESPTSYATYRPTVAAARDGRPREVAGSRIREEKE